MRKGFQICIAVLVFVAASFSLAEAQPAPFNPCKIATNEEVADPAWLVFNDPGTPNVWAVEWLYYDTADPTRGPFHIGNRLPITQAQVRYPAQNGEPACLAVPWMDVPNLKKDGTRYFLAARFLNALEQAGLPSPRTQAFFFTPPPPPPVPVPTGVRVTP